MQSTHSSPSANWANIIFVNILQNEICCPFQINTSNQGFRFSQNVQFTMRFYCKMHTDFLLMNKQEIIQEKSSQKMVFEGRLRNCKGNTM